MRVVGQRIVVVGDSLTHHGHDGDPEIWNVDLGSNRASSQPGDLLASMLAERGADAVRTNARVGRSAWNFWARENTAMLLNSDRAFAPTQVIVMLGTNDAGLSMTSDQVAMTKLRDAYQAMGAEVWAIGPFSNTRLDPGAVDAVAQMMKRVFGMRFVDGRPLSLAVVPGHDGLHYDQLNARALAATLANAIETKVSPTTLWNSIGFGLLGIGVAFAGAKLYKHVKRDQPLLGDVGFPKISRDEIDALIQSDDPDALDVAQDAMLQRGDKLSQIAKVSGEIGEHTWANYELKLGDAPHGETRLAWRVTKDGLGRCHAEFSPFANGVRIVDQDPTKPSYTGVQNQRRNIFAFEENYYGGADFCERAAASSAWAIAKALKRLPKPAKFYGELSPKATPTERLKAYIAEANSEIHQALNQDNSEPEELYGLGDVGAERTPLEAKREILQLLMENKDGSREVARDIAIDHGMIKTANVKKITPVEGYQPAIVEIELDTGERFWTTKDVRIQPDAPLDFVLSKEEPYYTSADTGEKLQHVHPAWVFNTDHVWPEGLLKRYVNTWWPNDGSERLDGPSGKDVSWNDLIRDDSPGAMMIAEDYLLERGWKMREVANGLRARNFNIELVPMHAPRDQWKNVGASVDAEGDKGIWTKIHVANGKSRVQREYYLPADFGIDEAKKVAVANMWALAKAIKPFSLDVDEPTIERVVDSVLPKLVGPKDRKRPRKGQERKNVTIDELFGLDKAPNMLQTIARESQDAHEFARRAEAWASSESKPPSDRAIAKAWGKPSEVLPLIQQAREARQMTTQQRFKKLARGLSEPKVGDTFTMRGKKTPYTVEEIVKPARTIGTLKIGETIRISNGQESVEITNAQGAWIDGQGRRWAPKKAPAKLEDARDDVVADVVKTSAKNVEEPWGHKVFISDVFEQIQRDGRDGGMTLDEFKRELVRLHRANAIRLSRADYIGVMPHDKVVASETDANGAQFHFVNL